MMMEMGVNGSKVVYKVGQLDLTFDFLGRSGAGIKDWA